MATCTNSSGVKPDLALDQDQQCKIKYKPRERLTQRRKMINLIMA